MKVLEKVIGGLDSIVSGCSLVAVVIMTLAGVVMRKIVGQPFAWLEEMQLFFFVYAIFFGGSVAFRTGGQVSIDLIANRLKPGMRKLLDIFDYVVTMGVLIYLCKGGFELAMSVAGKVTPYFKISYAFIDIAAPVGILLMIVQYTFLILHELTDKKEEKGVEEV